MIFLLVARQLTALWDPLFEADGRGGGVQQGGGAILWAPVVQDNGSNAFGQVGGGYFHDMWAGSVGGGYRRYVRPWLAFGVNGFIDAARSSLDATYTQGGFGLEAFGPIWEARLNAYFPVNRQIFARRIPSSALVLDGVTLLRESRLLEEFEQPYKGFDGEVGAFVRIFGGEAWGYAGGYFFTAPQASRVVGPRARFEYRKRLAIACSELVVGIEYTHDNVNRHSTTGSIRWNIPIVFPGQRANRCRAQSSLQRRLGEPVRRQPAIWTQRTTRVRGTGAQPVMGIFCVDNVGGGGVGTQADPMHVAQVTGPGGAVEGDAIIFSASQGPINIESAGPAFLLKDNQILAGFGNDSTIVLPLPGGGTYTITSTVPVPGRGTATAPSGGDVIVLANNNSIFGICINGGAKGIVGATRANLRIDDVDFDNLTVDGVNLTDISGNVVVTNSQFVDTLAGTGRAIRMTNTNTNATVTIDGNQIASTGAPATYGGIDLIANDLSVITGSISQNTLVNLDGQRPINIEKTGIGGSLDLTISQNTISDLVSVNEAIRIFTPGNSSAWDITLRISDNVLANVDDFGIFIDGNANTGAGPATMNAMICNNVIGPGGNTSAGDTAIEVRADTQLNSRFDLIIDNNRIMGFAGRGIEILNQDNPLICATITNNSNIGLPASTIEAWSVRNQVGTQAGITCLTMRGNTTDRTASTQNIELKNTTGDTLCVTNLATLGVDNPRTNATPSTVSLVGTDPAGIRDSTVAPCPGACATCALP